MARRPRSARSTRNWPSYRLAVLDRDFLFSPAMRGVRLQIECTKADDALHTAGVRSTLVVFGSSRITEDGPGQQAFWYAEARRFGRIASERGGALHPPKYRTRADQAHPGQPAPRAAPRQPRKNFTS